MNFFFLHSLVCYRNGGAITLHWFQSWPSAAARVGLKAEYQTCGYLNLRKYSEGEE